MSLEEASRASLEKDKLCACYGYFMICYRWILQDAVLQLDFFFLSFKARKLSSDTHFPQVPKWFCNKSVNLISLLC